MKNNETKCKDVLRWQCVLRCYLVPSKTFSRNKTYKIVHLVPLKTFSRNKMRGTSDFLTFMTRGSGKERSDEISHAARAFSLLLAGGALARVMKLTAGGRGAFSFEDLTGADS